MPQFLNFGNGHDGDDNLNGVYEYQFDVTCTATAASKVVTSATLLTTFDEGDMVFLYSTVTGRWEQNYVVSFTNAFTMNLLNACDYNYDYCALVDEFNNGIIDAGAVWRPGYYSFVCFKSLIVKGDLDVRPYSSANAPFDGGNGTDARSGAAPAAFAGNGTGGTFSTPRQFTANGSGGGGGAPAGDGGPGGGGGGNAAVGTTGGAGQGTAGIGGNAMGDTTLATIGGGGGGGGAGESNNGSGADGGTGGRGCGFLILFAEKFIIEDTGFVYLDGEAGYAASDNGFTQEGAGGGGGGSGGSFFLKSKYANINTNKIRAPGGTGGVKVGTASGNGGAGSDGIVRIEACTLVGSSTNPTPTYSTGGHAWCSLTPQIY